MICKNFFKIYVLKKDNFTLLKYIHKNSFLSIYLNNSHFSIFSSFDCRLMCEISIRHKQIKIFKLRLHFYSCL